VRQRLGRGLTGERVLPVILRLCLKECSFFILHFRRFCHFDNLEAHDVVRRAGKHSSRRKRKGASHPGFAWGCGARADASAFRTKKRPEQEIGLFPASTVSVRTRDHNRRIA
jgi:hypothetical protein